MFQKSKKVFLHSATLLLLLGSLFAVPVGALTRTYETKDTSIKAGMVVAAYAQKQQSGPNTTANTQNSLVQKANQSNADLTIGIVSEGKSDELTYSAGQPGEIVVADTGRVSAYVSDINGVPQPGDLLAASPLDGILMKAVDGTKGIVGALVDSFPSGKAQTYKLKDGASAKIAILDVNLDVRPVGKASSGNGLQTFIGRLIGHDTTGLQAFVALGIVTIMVIAIGGVVYAGVANYLTGIGRNPLAARQLRRGLVSVVGLVVALTVLSFAACWAVLWL